MTEITWISIVGVLLLIGQILSLYNSMAAARKNATAPFDALRAMVKTNSDEIVEIRHEMTGMKNDIDSAFNKIRENKEETERTAKAQNAALIQILLLLKEPTNRNDQAIDETIKNLSNI